MKYCRRPRLLRVYGARPPTKEVVAFIDTHRDKTLLRPSALYPEARLTCPACLAGLIQAPSFSFPPSFTPTKVRLGGAGRHSRHRHAQLRLSL